MQDPCQPLPAVVADRCEDAPRRAGLGSAGRVDVRALPDAVVAVEFAGEVDAAFAPRVREVLLGALLRRQASAVLIDLHDATFLDPSVLGAIVAGVDAAQDLGVPLLVRSVSSHVVGQLLDSGLPPQYVESVRRCPCGAPGTGASSDDDAAGNNGLPRYSKGFTKGMDTAAESVVPEALSRVVESLQDRFPAVSAALIIEHVERARGHYTGAPIRDFVSVMVERDVTAELAAVTQAGRHARSAIHHERSGH